MTSGMGVCAFCRRLRPGLTCSAYPDGIPTAIVWGVADHRLPIAGDNGILFAARDAEAEALVVQLFGETPVAYEGPLRLPDPVLERPEGIPGEILPER